ncbi:hypothetical protein CLIB1423_06S01706 [[Candida] railenensis]|uniref:Uncharacterized protein n=1 Tax=[Candida] railenensis TaxID=45579 RepID=A0A9P0QNX9_9ASCO|nr:hypothetical protein CLIB1423_06S01706 [[Candida] railenensis]
MTDVFEHRKTGSISSISSDEETRELIESLESETKRKQLEQSYSKVDGNEKTLEPTKGSQINAIDTNTTNILADISSGSGAGPSSTKTGAATVTSVPGGGGDETATDIAATPTSSIPIKKPIKFTVRKVSHDYVTSPEPNSYNTRKSSGSRSGSDGGGVGNNSPTTESLATIQLQENVAHSQEKYDQYSKKIEQIQKEIVFLQNLLPPYNVTVDYQTRIKITNAVEKLKMKRDEWEKKKYSLGITISRLWRSMDDNDIWVRSMGKQ